MRKYAALVGVLAGTLACAPSALAMTRHDGSNDPASSAPANTTFLSSATYSANENVGQFPITIERTTDISKPEVIYYGVTLKGAQAGENFVKIPNTRAVIPAGQSSYTFDLTVKDQGINGPPRYATAYIFGPNLGTLGEPSKATVTLLQNDPLQVRNPDNPLGYQKTPTDGDPLQYVNWYVFGAETAPGEYAQRYARSNPQEAQALHRLAYTPGSWSYRFWMWNMPIATAAKNVEKYLADRELRQPGTTVPITTYSLVHGACMQPSSIESRYQHWITQVAHGIGNFRVVVYLEIDAILERHCLSAAQYQIRLKDEIAYAVKALAQDPHTLVYIDAGAPGVYNSVPQTAEYLREADIAQAAGFVVNSTHYNWLTDDINWGQRLALSLGGAHFIVQSDDDGRGPYVPNWETHKRNGDTCNPPGRGAGPLTWKTGYEYVDGLLWFNDPGNSDGPCHPGDPPIGVFWPSYAVGLMDRATDKVLGPSYRLLTSNTNM